MAEFIFIEVVFRIDSRITLKISFERSDDNFHNECKTEFLKLLLS